MSLAAKRQRSRKKFAGFHRPINTHIMRHLFAILLLTISSTVLSQSAETVSKPVHCFPLSIVVDMLSKDFGESVIFQGRNTLTGADVALAENPDTGSWTMIEYDKEVACILATGRRAPTKQL